MLLELDESQHSERTVFIPPPEAGPKQQKIIYKTFKLNPELMRPQKNFSLKNPTLSAFTIVPGSPMARRTKHEIKVAQRMARKQVRILFTSVKQCFHTDFVPLYRRGCKFSEFIVIYSEIWEIYIYKLPVGTKNFRTNSSKHTEC